MKRLTSIPYDKIMRTSLNNIEVAREFLKTHLSKEVFKTIKLKTLSLCPNSYITPDLDLEETRSDILYKAKTIIIKIYLLIFGLEVKFKLGSIEIKVLLDYINFNTKGSLI